MTTKHKNIFHVATKYFLLLACDEVVASACTTARRRRPGRGACYVLPDGAAGPGGGRHGQQLQRGAHAGEYLPLIGPRPEY